MKTIVHAAAFFNDKAPEYRASSTRARTSAGLARACTRASRCMRITYPAAVMVRTYAAADNSPAPAGFLTRTGLMNS